MVLQSRYFCSGILYYIDKTEDFDELIESIQQTAHSGYNLLENLLEWSRSQTGKIEHNPEILVLGKLIKTNASMLLYLALSVTNWYMII